MKFRDFLLEKKENHAVLAFGRMNPITSGHQKLVDTVKKIASRVNGSHHIILSHSQDPKKNPLSAAQKVKHAKRAFPGTNFSASEENAPNFLAQAAKLHQSGVTHLHMIGGSDRVEEFHRLLHKYNGTHQGALFNFKKIEVHSAGDRDPDAEGTTGISASKMREHAKNKTTMSSKKVRQQQCLMPM
jgi:nicotinamide mononucleotide adenylyltransferase